MTTIPLSRVISYLRRKDVGIECLEGAPVRPTSTSRQVLYAVNKADLRAAEGGADTLGLFLGDGSICPAAMGWATVVLSSARGAARWFDPDLARLYDGEGAIVWEWDWTRDPDMVGERRLWTLLPAPEPPTPAARLLAVLEYEMERP